MIQSKPVVIDTACDWVRFITVGVHEELTPATARQILAHNKAVKKNCP